MSEQHVEAMNVLKQKKAEYASRRKEFLMKSGNTSVKDNNVLVECQLLLLEISYLESRVLSLSPMDISFIK